MQNDTKIQHQIVQTYAEDMAEVLENDKSGLVKKIIHGEEEREREKLNLSPESRRNRFFMLAGFLLFLLGTGVLVYFFYKTDLSTTEIPEQFTPLIFSDRSDFVEIAALNKDKIAQTILNKVLSTEVKAGGVEGFYLTEEKKTVSLRRFLSLIKSNFAPGGIHIVDDNFLLGVVNVAPELDRPASPDFFVLLKVRSLSDVFETLRAWENKMFLDLHGFFGVAISPDTSYLLTKNFSDGIIQNRNARILYDKAGGIVMMYVLADDNSLIVARSESATREIILRLASSGAQK